MPNLLTITGMLQLTGMGVALLLLLFLRARRYGGSITPFYAVLWLAACTGAAIQGVVEQHHDLMAMLPHLLVAALVPLMAACGLQSWLIQRRKRGLTR